MIAIHHPPMKTGIGFIDMVGAQWYAGIRNVIERHPQVQLVIAGHGHTVYARTQRVYGRILSQAVIAAPTADILAAFSVPTRS